MIDASKFNLSDKLRINSHNDAILIQNEDDIKLRKENKADTFCIWCGLFFDSIIETRKHHFAEHYEYCFEQCSNDVKILQDWMELPEPD